MITDLHQLVIQHKNYWGTEHVCVCTVNLHKCQTFEARIIGLLIELVCNSWLLNLSTEFTDSSGIMKQNKKSSVQGAMRKDGWLANQHCSQHNCQAMSRCAAEQGRVLIT